MMPSDVYYQSRAPVLYGGTISLQILSTLVVALRFIARRVAKAGLWWDDWVIVPALVGTLSLLAIPHELKGLDADSLSFSCSIGVSVHAPGTRRDMPDLVVIQKLLADLSRSNRFCCSSKSVDILHTNLDILTDDLLVGTHGFANLLFLFRRPLQKLPDPLVLPHIRRVQGIQESLTSSLDYRSLLLRRQPLSGHLRMQPNRGILGQVHTRRQMCQHRRFLQMERSDEPPHRLHDPDTPPPYDLAPELETPTENSTDRTLLAGSIVSAPPTQNHT